MRQLIKHLQYLLILHCIVNEKFESWNCCKSGATSRCRCVNKGRWSEFARRCTWAADFNTYDHFEYAMCLET